MPTKPTLAAVVVRGVLDDLGAIREFAADDPEAVREIAGGASTRLERALADLDRQERGAASLSEAAVQKCRGCGREFPYDPDADFCAGCAAENAGEEADDV